MKRSTHLGKRLLALALVLCTITIVAFAAGYSRKVTTNIVVDGKLYSNTTNFEWDMEYVVPVGGIEWDGTEDFMEITYPDDGDIIESPDGTPYIKNQLTFFAVQGASIGSEFDSVQNLMASYGIRIIGYIAPTAEYQVETASDVSFEDLQALISQLNSEPLITSETVKLSWIYSIVPTQVYTASTVPGTIVYSLIVQIWSK